MLSSVSNLSAGVVRDILGLEPNPSCGFTAPTYHSALRVPAYGGERECAFSQYFLVAPERAMVLHRIRSDQLYHHYRGDSLEVLRLFQDGTGDVTVVGSDLEAGERPQLLIPGGTFHVSRVKPGGRWALLGTTVFPGLEPVDVELGRADQLAATYPTLADEIRSFGAGSGASD
jgi:predicted cupin superfamily sugar epimerase